MHILERHQRSPFDGVVLALFSEGLKSMTVIDLSPEGINSLLFRGLVSTCCIGKRGPVHFGSAEL